MKLNRNEIIGTTAEIRHRFRKKVPNSPFDPAGLLSGLVYREQEYAQYLEKKDSLPKNQVSEQWRRILTLSENLPMPFWNGIHPNIAKKIYQHLSSPDHAFWQTPLMDNVRPAKKTRVIKVEPGISDELLQPQLNFFEKYLPKGSLSYIFATRGNDTIWGKVPLANAFAENPHQMSLPPFAQRLVRGINTLLLTTTASTTVPKEWNMPFPAAGANAQDKTMNWMNLHQVGHCMVIPTCWEYLDRNYALVTPLELLNLTELRLKALNEWFLRYYGEDATFLNSSTSERKPLEPDTTTYLYEIKIIENALYVLDQVKNPDTKPREKILWFKGFHVAEIAEQLNISEEKIWQGVWAMDAYLMEHHHSEPTHPIYNSAIHSTDVGTHPIEEIVVDVIAQKRADINPKGYEYWDEYVKMVFDIWSRWEKQNKEQIQKK